MRNILTAFLTVLLLCWGAWQLLQLPAAAVQMTRAGEYYASVMRALEDSCCDPVVVRDCTEKAARAGYRLTVEPVAECRSSRLCRVELAYTVRLWGGSDGWTEVLGGYAG